MSKRALMTDLEALGSGSRVHVPVLQVGMAPFSAEGGVTTIHDRWQFDFGMDGSTKYPNSPPSIWTPWAGGGSSWTTFGRRLSTTQKAVQENGGVRVETSRMIPLEVDPHYSDPRFHNAERTIFGKKSDDIGYVYSDRLCQGDRRDKSRAAWKEAIESMAPPTTAMFYEKYLSAYMGAPVKMVHIMVGIGPDWYPYLVFGFKDKV